MKDRLCPDCTVPLQPPFTSCPCGWVDRAVAGNDQDRKRFQQNATDEALRYARHEAKYWKLDQQRADENAAQFIARINLESADLVMARNLRIARQGEGATTDAAAPQRSEAEKKADMQALLDKLKPEDQDLNDGGEFLDDDIPF